MTDQQQICELIAAQPDLVVVTANAAIAQEVKSRLLKGVQQTRGLLSRISDLDSWLERQARQQLEGSDQILANYQQLLQIWEKVIDQDSHKYPDLQARVLAPQAQRSWLRMLRWNIDRKELAELEKFNDLKLSKWIQLFESRLQKEGLSHTGLALQKYQPATKGRAVLYLGSGDALAPAQLNYLQSAFEQLSQNIWRDSSLSADCFRMSFAKREEELVAAATWAKNLLVKQPDSRIAILCTETGAQKKQSVRALQAELNTFCRPRLCHPKDIDASGILDSALRLLEINRHKLSRADCRALIQSPFWGNYPQDLQQRALWETLLCSLERKYIETRDFLNTARKAATKLGIERQQSFAERINLLVQSNSGTGTAPLQYWADLFNRQLQILGWPGQRLLTPAQKAQVELWNDLLTTLVSLGAIEGETDLDTAVRLLRRIVSNARLPADKTGNGVNILDTVESAVGFEHIWLLGADANNWPNSARPDPLIPIQMQIKYGIPRCRADQEREFCLNLFDQLRGNCQQLVFSIAQTDANQITEFSPLLPAYAELDLPKPGATPPPATEKNWQWIDCRSGPKLDLSPATTKGGSTIFNLMAASPFIAFAQLRLAAQPLPEAFLGIGPHHRGSILHACLEQIWAQLEDSKTLEPIPEHELITQIESVVNEQLLDWQNRNFHLELAYFEDLKSFFCDLLLEWLLFEKTRPPFSVQAREQSLTTQIGPLNLNLRIDRIDRLESGELLLIDYKSGASASEKDLLSSPPAAAQLPLYAISLDEQLCGAGFALLVSGKTGIKGVASGEGILSLKAQEDWPALVNQWREDLTALAQAFAEGDCRVVEAPVYFGGRDELAPLHRMAEYNDLMDWYASL